MGHGTQREHHARRLVRVIGVGLVAALGLLLWARLKLVTATPRMVYADPDAQTGGSPLPPPTGTDPAR